MPAFEMNVLCPLSVHPRLDLSARVATSFKLEPASGSVSANAAMRSPRATSRKISPRSFGCAPSASGYEPSPCMTNITSSMPL
jgi:hypothetical protein